MPGSNERETGARAPKAAVGKEPQDDFDQDAAGNKPPPHGVGITESLAEERVKNDGSDLRGGSVATPEAADFDELPDREMESHVSAKQVRKSR